MHLISELNFAYLNPHDMFPEEMLRTAILHRRKVDQHLKLLSDSAEIITIELVDSLAAAIDSPYIDKTQNWLFANKVQLKKASPANIDEQIYLPAQCKLFKVEKNYH